MAFVPLGVTWPTLSNFNVQFQGSASSPVVFNTVPVFIQDKSMEGFDLPATRTGDSNRPRARGEFIGLDEFSGRDLTLTVDVGGSNLGSYATTAAALSALRAVTNTADLGNVEYPMFVKFPNEVLLGIMARARKRTFIPTAAYALGNLAKDVAIQWHATDPFFYSQTQSNTIGLPVPGSGLVFPITFPLSFGSGGGVSSVSLTNSGDVECYPILTITGPCTYPSITNTSISGSPTIQFGVTMPAGDQLVIDMDLKTATYYTAGSSLGQTAMATLQQGWTWWSIQPGVNQIQFASTDNVTVAGTLNVAWASSYSSAI